MSSEQTEETRLHERIEQIRREAGAERVAAAYFDYETGHGWDHQGDQWFHAASTIKLAVLLGLFHTIDSGDLSLNSRLHVRNRFLSVVDGQPFRVESGRDANSEVHAYLGRTMKIRDLARHMIVTSSNLATNLLIDIVGLSNLQDRLRQLGLGGVELRRGVEDERAFTEGINNQVTANGLLSILRLIKEAKIVSAEAADHMLSILHQQEFRSGIPAGLPEEARVANKTGEISTVAHDAGLIYLPERAPFAMAILSEWAPDTTSGRRDMLARISRAIYECFQQRGKDA